MPTTNPIAPEYVRRAGMIQPYLGTDGSLQGFIDEYDGRWLYLTLDSFRTIGNAGSNAHLQGTWLLKLYEALWFSFDNTQCPVLTAAGAATTRGESALFDFNSTKRLTLPDLRGRVLGGCGSGGSLAARAKGSRPGAETHTLTEAQIPAHVHAYQPVVFQSGGGIVVSSGSAIIGNANTGSAGGGQAHNNMQPSAFEHLLIACGVRVLA